MRLQDLFAKIVNLDPTKEYDVVESFSMNELNTTTTETNTSPQDTVKSLTVKDVGEKSSQNTDESQTNIQDELERLRQQNDALQKANYALLNRIPVQETQKTIEENILEIAKLGGNVYGISSTSTEP